MKRRDSSKIYQQGRNSRYRIVNVEKHPSGFSLTNTECYADHVGEPDFWPVIASQDPVP